MATQRLLSGSSPASAEAAALLAPLAAAVAASGRTPASVEELRGLGPEAAAALDAWTGDYGLDRLQPGDILVTPFTTPAYNTVAPLLGGLITEEGGVMSHAAFLARECGIPAVLGVAHATQLIGDGTTITIDPAAGLVASSQAATR